MARMNMRLRRRDPETGRWPVPKMEKPGRGREVKDVWLRTTKGGADLQPVVHPQGVYGGFSARDARLKRQAKSKRLTRIKRNTRRGVTSGQARFNRGRKRVIESATERR